MKNILLGIIAVAIVVTVAILVDRSNGVFGSTIDGQEYYSKYLDSTNGSTTNTQIKTGQGVLGSIIVASTTVKSFVLYDATSTMSTSTATKLASFSTTGQANGTYQYDVAVTYGIRADVPASFAGLFVVTYK